MASDRHVTPLLSCARSGPPEGLLGYIYTAARPHGEPTLGTLLHSTLCLLFKFPLCSWRAGCDPRQLAPAPSSLYLLLVICIFFRGEKQITRIWRRLRLEPWLSSVRTKGADLPDLGAVSNYSHRRAVPSVPSSHVLQGSQLCGRGRGQQSDRQIHRALLFYMSRGVRFQGRAYLSQAAPANLLTQQCVHRGGK